MNFKIFSPKNLAKNLAFLVQNTANFGKIWIVTLVLKKNANFFSRNSPKNRIMTSTTYEFVEISAKNVAQPIFLPKINADLLPWKKVTKISDYFCNLEKKLRKVNDHLIGEN
jgi:hypothetical protein